MKNIGAYILAGGKSKRMGQDKGLIPIDGKPMVQHVLEVLDKLFDDITIISNTDHYHRFGKKVIPDLISDKGPMGGIYTGLKDSPYKLNFFISCDMPFISQKAIKSLIDISQKDQITVPETAGNLQPLFAVYPNNIIPMLEKLLSENRLKMIRMIEESEHQKIHLPILENDLKKQFRNINTKEELQKLALEFTA